MKTLLGAVFLTLLGNLVAEEGLDPFAPSDPFASDRPLILRIRIGIRRK